MKKNLFYKWGFVALLALSMTWVGCEDDEDVPDPTYEAGTWFYSTLIDKVSHRDTTGFHKAFTTEYSFYFAPDKEVDTLELGEVRLMGMPVDYDREVNLVAGEGTTAVEGVNFEILDKTLPANAYSFIPKVLLKKEGLNGEMKKIHFVLEPCEEFPARVLGDTISDDATFMISTHYDVYFTDEEMEPPYWEQCGDFGLGKWIKVKYDFMVEKLGKRWGLEPIGPSDMNDLYNDYLRMRYELDKWKEEHGGEDMLDEDGEPVTFY